MHPNLMILNHYFKGGSAETERDIRSEVFTNPPEFERLLDFSSSKFKIIIAPKGVGKSFFLEEFNDSALVKNKVSVLIRPEDIDCDSILKQKTKGNKVSAASEELLKAIVLKIASTIKKSKLIRGNESKLYSLANELGMENDLLTNFTTIISSLNSTSTDIARAFRKVNSIKAPDQIRNAISDVLINRGDTFWLLVDDLDEAVAPGEMSNDYHACWAILRACFNLSNEIDNLNCMVSVRQDIWNTMIFRKKLGSELDKMSQPFKLYFDEQKIKDIFFSRIARAAREIPTENRIKRSINNFFHDKVVLPDGQTREWANWLAKMSRNRPRDLINLVECLIEANRHASEIIHSDCYGRTMQMFSKTRVDHIEREFGEVCPQIRYVIEDVSKQKVYDFVDLMDVLKRSPSSRSISVDGTTLRPGRHEDALELLRVLHMSNFLNPRVEDNSQPLNYNHILYSDTDNYITLENINQLQENQWEIHPVFHPYVTNRKDIF